jgi:hypothetical protein
VMKILAEVGLGGGFLGFFVLGHRCALRITGAHRMEIRWWLRLGLGAF